MIFLEPKKWLSWLSLAEWWYNTNYHNSLKYSPFEALYGYSPPLLSEVMIPELDSPALEFLYADTKRSEREFAVGDMVYLRFQPFRHAAFGLHQCLKLTTKYYGPFKVLERIGHVAYKLQLPDSADIHPVFHVSQLKKHLGARPVPQSNLPLVTQEGYIKTEPTEVLETRALPSHDDIVTQWKIKWQNLSNDQATGRTSYSSRLHSQSFIATQSGAGGRTELLVEKELLKGRGLS
jgi:hypothetical protein